MVEIFVCKTSDLKDGERRIVATGDTEVGIYRHKGGLFAYRNLCVHQGGPACEGITMPKVLEVFGTDRTLVGRSFDEGEMHIVCPWHGYEFKLATGECVGDRRKRLQRFPVTEREGGVYVTI